MRWFIRSFARSLSIILALCSLQVYAQDTSPQSIPSTGACLNKPLPPGFSYRNPVQIAMPPQSTAYLSTNIARILLTEVIGVPTEIVETHEDVAWSRIATGELHGMLEYWPSTAQAEQQKYFYDEETIIDAGPLGIIAQSGWYIPRYVLTDVPGALFGDFADPDVAAYFNNTVYVGDQDWLSIQYEIIAQNNFSLNVVELPGEDELMDLLYTHYAQKQPLLFYFWSPHLLPAHIQLIRVQLPNDTVYYPSQILGKVAWAELPAYSAEAAYLIQALSISNTIMDKLLAELNTDTVWNVTCNWIRNNEKSWENWIRPSDYQEIPMGLQIAMWVLSGLCIAGTLFYLIVTIKYRKSKVIIAASGAFLVSMCIGGAFMFGSVMAFVSNTDIGCNVFIWMLPLGFALLFGSLFAKTGRIYLLFSNKSLQLVKYTDRDVGLCVGVILLLECVVLAVMTGLQPADYAFQTESEREFTFCLFHLPTGVTLLAFNGVVMVFGIIVSVLVSRLRLSLYNEAKYIGLAMYNFGFVVIFVVVIFLVNDLTVRYALLCCCILFITMVSLSVLFIPKIRLLFTYTEEELHEMNEAQLQAVIRSYTKKFASSSTDKKNSTNKTSTTGGGNSTRVGALGSSFEDEMVNLASTVKAMSEQIKDLKAENKKLRETTSDDYRSLYEKYYHESMILKNQLFEFKQRYNKVPTDKDAKPDSTD